MDKLTEPLHRAALIVAIQNWLGESEQAKKNAAMPGYLSVGMSCTYDPVIEVERGPADDDCGSYGSRVDLSEHVPPAPGPRIIRRYKAYI